MWELVDDERSKKTFEFEFLMRSDMSNSSLLMRYINRVKHQIHQFYINYTILVKIFACGAFVLVAFVDSWGKARENIDL